MAAKADVIGAIERTGLNITKRELFAAMAMQGYCSVQEGWDQPAREVAKCAALMADALLAALNAEESK